MQQRLAEIRRPPKKGIRAMARLRKRRAGKVGLPPGTLVHIGERKSDHVELTVLDYDSEQLREYRPASVEECAPLAERATVSWLDVMVRSVKFLATVNGADTAPVIWATESSPDDGM